MVLDESSITMKILCLSFFVWDLALEKNGKCESCWEKVMTIKIFSFFADIFNGGDLFRDTLATETTETNHLKRYEKEPRNTESVSGLSKIRQVTS